MMKETHLKSALDRRMTGACLPENTKAAILACAEVAVPQARRKPVKRMTVFALVAAIMLSATVFAAASGLVSDWLQVFFPQADLGALDSLGTPLGVSSTDHGITITAEAAIRDERHLWIILTARKEDGTAFYQEQPSDTLRYSPDFSALKEYCSGITSSGEQISPAELRLDIKAELKDASQGAFPFDLRIENVEGWNVEDIDGTGKTKHYISQEGVWKLSISVPSAQKSKEFEAGQVLTNVENRLDAQISEITISPLSMKIIATQTFHGQDWRHSFDPILVLNDGTRLDCSNSAGSSYPADSRDGTYTWQVAFSQMVDLDEVNALQYGDQTIALVPKV